MDELRNRRRDDGMALPLVLFLVVVVGFVVAALLTQARSNLRATVVTNNQQDKVYAANAGLDWAIQRFRTDTTLCPTTGTAQTLSGAPAFNGRTLVVRCSTTSGSAQGSGGYAVFTTATSGTTFSTQGAANADKRVGGSISNGGGWSLQANLYVRGGSVQQYSASGCPAQNNRLTILGIGTYGCVPSRTTPSPVRSLAALQVAAAAPPVAAAPQDSTGCRVFTPGRYNASTRPFTLNQGGQNYLRAGVYVLDNTSLTLSSNNTIVVGGAPNNGDTDDLGLRAQLTSCPAAQTNEANGVVILLVGNAQVYVDRGSLELFSYYPNGFDSQAAQAIYQLSAAEASAPGWALSGGSVPATGLLTGGANNASLVIHGNVHMVRSGVDISASNNAVDAIQGGIVASTLSLQASASINPNNFLVSTRASAGRRRISVTVCAEPVNGDKRLIGTAIVDIANDSAKTTAVSSWRVNEDTNSQTICP